MYRFAVSVAFLAASPAPAEVSSARAECEAVAPLGPIGSATRELARLAEIAGAAPVWPELFVRPSSVRDLVLCKTPAPHPSLLPAATTPGALRVAPGVAWLRSYYRSGYPEDANDGAVWEGRGLTLAASASLEARLGPLAAAVAPVVAWTQNQGFDAPRATLPGYSPWASPYYGGHIDLPLRFGSRAFWLADAGDSHLRLDYGNVALGVSNENLWWGPGVRSTVLFTNTAPGFPHVFLGTSRPADVWIGWLDVQLMWGLPRESPYFTSGDGDNERFLAGLAVSFEPAFAPGLFLGAGRLYHFNGPPTIEESLRPLISPLLKSQVGGDDPDNQLGSLMARWVVPAARLEVYGEWGRDDHAWDSMDLLMEPGHATSFVVGLQHLTAVRHRWVRIGIEATHTAERPLGRDWRPDPTFYTHWAVRQGHTNDGQMLGAAAGPDADSQYLAIDVLAPDGGQSGAFVERTLRNERWYGDQVRSLDGHDLEIAGGVRQRLALSGFELEWHVGLARRWNAYFGSDRWNVFAGIEVSPRAGRRGGVGLAAP